MNIGCTIRCMEPAAVAAAMDGLKADGAARVPYTCQISGQSEQILLLGDRLAARLASALPEAGDVAGVRMLAGLASAELCACDVATLTRLPEDTVLERLQAFAAQGLLAQRLHGGMHYFRLSSERMRRRIMALAGTDYSQVS